MPYIKSVSIRNSVAGCLKYIVNPYKTEGQFYLTGLNCSEDIHIAEKEFCLTYQHYSHRNFYTPPSDNGKSPVKAFHLIQSFKAGECDAETAHKIGVEWVQSVFGKNFQAIIATHTDKEHIHNHICLCPYDLDGIKFNSNKRELERIRRFSDKLCKNYGIGEMEKMTQERNHIPVGVCYGEWRHKKLGTSWKEVIRSKIDSLIRSAKSLDELLEELERQGYTIKRGKYISVKAPEQQRAVRLKTLGADYSEESISRRIKKYLDSLPKIKSTDEILSEVIREYDVRTRKFNFAKSVQEQFNALSNQLNIVNTENLMSVDMVKSKLSEVQKTADETQRQIDEMESSINSAQEIIKAAERYFKKYGIFEKGKEYPRAQQKADKELLEKYNIRSPDDITEFKNSIENHSAKIENLKSALAGIKDKINQYDAIIETCESNRGDYISNLIKAAKEKMDEQEKIKLKSLQEETYEIYYPCNGESIPFSKLKAVPNIDDYYSGGGGNWFDIDGNDIGEKLENIYASRADMRIGVVILVKTKEGEKAYYTDEIGFQPLKDFEKSRSEIIEQQQNLKQQDEQKQKTAAKKKRGR